jgi:ribosomal protein L7/L12
MARLRCLAALGLRTKAEQTVDMAKKRTKSDKAQRQAEGLEKKLERRPAQVPKKKAA